MKARETSLKEALLLMQEQLKYCRAETKAAHRLLSKMGMPLSKIDVPSNLAGKEEGVYSLTVAQRIRCLDNLVTSEIKDYIGSGVIERAAERYFDEELSGEPLYQDMVVKWLVHFATSQLLIYNGFKNPVKRCRQVKKT